MLQEISVLPGRIRLKHQKLLYNKALATYLNVYIDNLSGVKCSAVNCHTATILVVFDHKKTNTGLLEQNINRVISASLQNKPKELRYYDQYHKTLEKRDRARRGFIIFGLIYLALKIKHSLYGKFSFSSNLRILQVASAITIIGGYPLLKGLYKRFAKSMPTDSDILLQLTALSFTLLRESSKGVLVLMLKDLNDYIKYSADAESQRLLNQSMRSTAGMAWLCTAPKQEVLVPVERLKANDIVSVHKGELVPAGGEVVEGSAVADSLYYTGQPVVTPVKRGHKVHEGLSLLSGELKVRVETLPDLTDKPDISREDLNIHRRVSSYQSRITPISLAAGIVSYAMNGDFLNALSVLLTLTPSGAGTALSTGLKGYVSLLSKHKIYLRNPNTMERIVHAAHIAFDKTGTLTYGKMKIESVHSFDSRYPEMELLKICAACEADNYHPISVTLQEASEGGFDAARVQSSVLLPSRGIAAVYDNHPVVIGNEDLMNEKGVDIRGGLNQYHDYEKKLFTPVFVGIDGELAGIIVMQDVLREDCYDMLERLKQRGFESISLLTGDQRDKADAIAAKLGIGDVYSHCSREDKQRIILDIKKMRPVIMVGDGVNDTHAMRSADVSVSFANSCCDKIKLHSDCIFFEDDMTRLADMIALSRKAHTAIHRSITFSQLYNIFWGALALLGHIDPFAAKSINTVNSLLVLLLNKRIEYLHPGRFPGKKDA